MTKMLALPFLGLLVLTAQDKDDLRDRIKEAGKKLSSGKAKTRLEGIEELGSLRHADARSLLIKKLSTDTDEIRLAAARALVRHHQVVCAKALANAILHNKRQANVVKGLLEALGDLDMCVGIPILVKLMHSDIPLAQDCLKQLEKINCPEALDGILLLLYNAEKEARKPDTFSDLGITDRNKKDRLDPTRNKPRTFENKNKDKELAALVEPAKAALQTLTGKRFKNHQGWSEFISGGGRPHVRTRVYFCYHAGKTFKMPGNRPPKCPFKDTPTRHEDIFQKHCRE